MARPFIRWGKSLMKAYVGTLLNLPESVEMAERCKESGEKFGVDVEIFPAVWKDVALGELKTEDLKMSSWDESYSNVGAVVGNFITQYRIWQKILDSGEDGIILEHDAVFTDYIPELTNKGDIINLGKPSYGRFKTKTKAGVYPLFSKSGYFPGAHAYIITPNGAQQLIDKTKQIGAAPCDMFLNNKNFPNIKEIYPWIVEARDEFTTIQKEKGCTAKHNYNKDFKILT